MCFYYSEIQNIIGTNSNCLLIYSTINFVHQSLKAIKKIVHLTHRKKDKQNIVLKMLKLLYFKIIFIAWTFNDLEILIKRL